MAPEALMRQLAYEPSGRDLPTMFDLPSENPEEPGLPDVFHPLQAFLLSITFRLNTSFFSALDLNLYYDEHNTHRYIRPDWFVVLGAPPSEELRRSYVIWQERVRPFLAVELISPGSEKDDLGMRTPRADGIPTKWDVYEKILQVPYYIVYDRFEDHLIPHIHSEKGYQPLTMEKGLVSIPDLSLKLGRWHGRFNGEEATWLRWFDAEGFMIPTPDEEKDFERAEKERERAAKEKALDEKVHAEAELTRMRNLLRDAGIDIDKL